MEPQQYKIKEFSYDLPEERIAKYPLPERDLSKLLIYKNGKISESIYRNIDEFIPKGSLLVFNNTKVVQARLNFKNANGAKIEIFCLEPAEENSEPTSVMLRQKSVLWKCLVGRANRWKQKILTAGTGEPLLTAEVIEREGEIFKILFKWTPEDLSFAEVLTQVGSIPIPPYLKRESEAVDLNRYQTVYAKYDGSVAAPTAGLHFTENIFNKLKQKHIEKEYVTLHVGAGTFKPVKSETMRDHVMHSEWINVSRATIENLLNTLANTGNTKKIISVGTTSMRTIESLYWMGVKSKLNPNSDINKLETGQWDAYELNGGITAEDSLESLLIWMKKNELERVVCKTRLMIAPSYKLKIADVLVTNFHQPYSTLLLLVAAVVGEDWKNIYNYALENNFRFLSYGDGCLLFSGKE